MYNVLRHIVAITLSALLVLSTVSFTVDMHFCGSHLVDFAINDKAHGCGMQMEDMPGNHASAIANPNMGCCQNVHYTITGQDDLQASNFDYSIIQPIQLGEATVLPAIHFDDSPGEAVLYRLYQPPPNRVDLSVLYQVFRI
jgi:hypothetical protein